MQCSEEEEGAGSIPDPETLLHKPRPLISDHFLSGNWMDGWLDAGPAPT